MNKLLLLALALIVATLFAIFWLLAPERAEATRGQGQLVIPKGYVCHCQASACQTLHIAIPAVVAHLTQHEDDYAGACEEEPEEPTPTPDEPEVTPEPRRENPPTAADRPQGSTTEAPGTCPDQTPGEVANIYVDRGAANDGRLEVRWIPAAGANKAHIRYSEVDGQWRYALLDTDNDGTEVIGELKNGTHYWFQVAGVNNCKVGPWSRSFDPLP